VAYYNGDFQECERRLVELLDVKEENSYALYNLSVLYAAIHRANWKEYYKRSLELNPELLSTIGDRSLLVTTPDVEKKLPSTLNASAEEIEIL
jgi:phage gpG-like protein